MTSSTDNTKMSKNKTGVLGTYFVLVFDDNIPISYGGIIPLFNDEFGAKSYLKKMEGLFPPGKYQVKRINMMLDETYKTILNVTLFDPYEDGVVWGDDDCRLREKV